MTRRPQMRQHSAERDLVGRMRARDGSAVTELASLYGPRIEQLAFRYLKNREDAEEVAQDVLMKVYRKVEAFRGDSALSSWIYRITFNTAMSRLRNGRVARAADKERERLESAAAVEDQVRAPRQPADWSNMPDEELLRAQLRHAVTAAIAELPEIYRAPVVLRDIQGLTTEEASSRLHLKDQTLKSRLHRGRLMLRERLSAFASGLNLHGPSPAY